MLGTVWMLSRAWHRLHVFPRLVPPACFATLGTSCMYSRAWYQLRVFPPLAPVACFPRLVPVACFPALGTSWMFSCASGTACCLYFINSCMLSRGLISGSLYTFYLFCTKIWFLAHSLAMMWNYLRNFFLFPENHSIISFMVYPFNPITVFQSVYTM